MITDEYRLSCRLSTGVRSNTRSVFIRRWRAVSSPLNRHLLSRPLYKNAPSPSRKAAPTAFYTPENWINPHSYSPASFK